MCVCVCRNVLCNDDDDDDDDDHGGCCWSYSYRYSYLVPGTVFCIVNWLFGLYYLLGLPSLVSRSNAPITNMTSTEGTYYVRPSWNARGPVCHAATLPRRSIDRSIDIDDESTEDGGQREKIDQWSTGR